MSTRSVATARLRRWLPRLIGLALSVVAIVVVGPRDVARGLRAANPWLVAIAAVAVFPLLAPKARRWQIVLADFGIALPWRDAFRFYAIGLWAAIVTPGQLGDGLKAWYVQSRGGNLAPALASVVVDRLFDVLMLLAAAALGVAVYGAAFGAQFALVGSAHSGDGRGDHRCRTTIVAPPCRDRPPGIGTDTPGADALGGRAARRPPRRGEPRAGARLVARLLRGDARRGFISASAPLTSACRS